jgi:hypothetical protein
LIHVNAMFAIRLSKVDIEDAGATDIVGGLILGNGSEEGRAPQAPDEDNQTAPSSAIAAGRRAGTDRSRIGGRAFVPQWTADAKEIRPVPILEARAGLTKPALGAIASFALGSETLFKRLGRSSQDSTHDKRADEQLESHCALSTSIERR